MDLITQMNTNKLVFDKKTDVYYFDSVTSTQTLIDQITLINNPILVVANYQSQGKGRYSKSFYSPAGNGIYLSYKLHSPIETLNVSYLILAVAVTLTDVMLDLYNISTVIKWPNDIYIHDKKIAGILCQTTLDEDNHQFKTVTYGIGINLYHDSNIPSILNNLYTAIEHHYHGTIDKEKLIRHLINTLNLNLTIDSSVLLEKYKERNYILGSYFTYEGCKDLLYAQDINEKGQLIARNDLNEIIVLNTETINLVRKII